VSVLALGAAAALVVITGALAARHARRRQVASSHLARPSLDVGVVVVCEGEHRVIDSVLVFCEGGEPIATLHLEGGDGLHPRAVATFAPPSKTLGWLTARTVDLAPAPPLRLELDGVHLERSWSRPVSAKSRGETLPPTAPLRLACYRGGVRALALVLHAPEGARLYAGTEVEVSDVDILGHARP